MSIIAGPNITPTGNGVIYLMDPGNQKCYSSTENLYPTSENWGALLTSSTPSPYYQVSSGGPYGGAYYITTVTNAASSNYWFEWGNTVSLNAGDTVTQTFHIRPITTSSGTLQTAALQFWTGAGRAWTTTRYVQFTLGTTASVLSYSFGTSTGSISALDNGWYRISQTAIADQAGYSGMSLFISGNVGFNTGTIYHFAAAQIERNTRFTGYVPTYGTAKGRSLTLNDISGNYSASTFVNATPLYVPSNGGYFSFTSTYTATSTSSYINTAIRGDTTFTSSSSFSISAWWMATNYVTTVTNSITGMIVGCTNYDGYGIGWYPSGSTSTIIIRSQMRTRGGYIFSPTYDFTANLNQWYHYVMSYNYKLGTSIFYVNGVNVGNFTIPAAANTGVYQNIIGQAISLASPFPEGGPPASPTSPGNLGVVTIHNQALTQDQVQQLFYAYRGRYGV